MYMFIYVCLCACVCVSVCMCKCVCVYACAFACMRANACVTRIFTKLDASKAGFSQRWVHFSRFSLESDVFRRMRDSGPL